MPPRSLCELSASAVAIPAAAAGSVGFNVTATRNHVGLDLACKPLGSRPDIAALLAANPIQFGTSVDPSSASKRNRVFCGSSLMQHAQPLSAIPSRSDPSVSHHPCR
ncbi:uncharacterized protein PAN0_014c4825 [Moesziomyces antarcticus]|uniref:Uncharacterized protein n=2 Tax=Pseudozyma antarctica TaxID=84753 RepID=A0A081CIV6_PSEA2|nr:uncharacterized protein PAN0_014c4825 [Moesziomyces antarcticus]GAK66602.1 hypothetical protein PAN0_014c4825 [Moesziomyces antarcticus]SPO47651.1 uncharacterized protein PSANT_05339 [Moesziomyces antarcticus]